MLKFFLSRSYLAFFWFLPEFTVLRFFCLPTEVSVCQINFIWQPEISWRKRCFLLVWTHGSLLNLSRSVHCSVINVLFCCHPFSATACLLYHFEADLSTTFLFFELLFCNPYGFPCAFRCSRGQLVYIIIIILECQHLFSTIFSSFFFYNRYRGTDFSAPLYLLFFAQIFLKIFQYQCQYKIVFI